MMKFFKRFGSHYAIERFGFLFLVLAIGMAVLVSFIGTKQIRYNHQSLSGQAIYTTEFAMSQTGSIGEVTNLVTNEDHTKMIMMIHFDDMSMLPTDVNDYSLRIFGSDKNQNYEELESFPSGLLYMFGTSGDMAIYLQDYGGFPSQIIAIQLVSNIVLSQNYSNEVDYGIIYCNPGGDFATQVDFLDDSDWMFFDLVEEIVTRSDEGELRNTLNSDLWNMAQDEILIDEYTARLEDLGVIVPAIPTLIDDEVYAMSDDGERLHYTTDFGGGWVTEDESVGYREDEIESYYLDSSHTIPGGFDFNWQDGRILTGYLNQLTGSTDPEIWLEYMDRTEDALNASVTFESEMNNIVWKMDSGEEVANANLDTYTAEAITEAIDLLTETWQDFYDYKEDYQCVTLPAYLELEYEANMTYTNFTINSSDDVVTLYNE